MQALPPRKPASRQPATGPTPGQLALFLLAVMVCAFLFVFQRHQFTKLGYEVSLLRKAEAEALQKLEPMKLEAQTLSRPERIEEIARTRLGMRPPQPHQVIIVEQE